MCIHIKILFWMNLYLMPRNAIFFWSRWLWLIVEIIAKSKRFTGVGWGLNMWLNLTLFRVDRWEKNHPAAIYNLCWSYLSSSSFAHWSVSWVCSRWDIRAIHQSRYLCFRTHSCPEGLFFSCRFTVSHSWTSQFFLLLASRTAVI